jgi:hypothetical protein
LTLRSKSTSALPKPYSNLKLNSNPAIYDVDAGTAITQNIDSIDIIANIGMNMNMSTINSGAAVGIGTTHMKKIESGSDEDIMY